MGHLLYKSYTLEVGTDPQYTLEIVFPFDVNLIRGKFFDSTDYTGDLLSLDIAPDTVIGKTIINSSVNQLMLYVDATTIEYMEVGYNVKITDGVNTSVSGMCLSKSADSITFENPLTHNFNAGAYIQMTVPMMDRLSFQGSGAERTVEGTQNTVLLPKATPMLITYDNTTGTAKTFIFDLEILF
jgi:hypothetical protein